jgi:hypothetical protein
MFFLQIKYKAQGLSHHNTRPKTAVGSPRNKKWAQYVVSLVLEGSAQCAVALSAGSSAVSVDSQCL